MRKLVIAACLLLTSLFAGAQSYVSTADDIALGKLVLERLAAAPQQDPGAQMILAAKALLVQPYEAATQ